MTVAEINKARELLKTVRGLEQRVARLKLSYNNIVPVLNGMPHATLAKSKVETLALLIVEGEHNVDALRAAWAEAKADVANVIMCEIDDPICQAMFLLRYVECLPFKEVAQRMQFSVRHVFRLHDETLKRCHIEGTPCHPHVTLAHVSRA